MLITASESGLSRLYEIRGMLKRILHETRQHTSPMRDTHGTVFIEKLEDGFMNFHIHLNNQLAFSCIVTVYDPVMFAKLVSVAIVLTNTKNHKFVDELQCSIKHFINNTFVYKPLTLDVILEMYNEQI